MVNPTQTLVRSANSKGNSIFAGGKGYIENGKVEMRKGKEKEEWGKQVTGNVEWGVALLICQ